MYYKEVRSCVIKRSDLVPQRGPILYDSEVRACTTKRSDPVLQRGPIVDYKEVRSRTTRRSDLALKGVSSPYYKSFDLASPSLPSPFVTLCNFSYLAPPQDLYRSTPRFPLTRLRKVTNRCCLNRLGLPPPVAHIASTVANCKHHHRHYRQLQHHHF